MNRYQITNGTELNQITKLGQSLMTLMTGTKTRACPREVHGYSLTYYYGGKFVSSVYTTCFKACERSKPRETCLLSRDFSRELARRPHASCFVVVITKYFASVIVKAVKCNGEQLKLKESALY